MDNFIKLFEKETGSKYWNPLYDDLINIENEYQLSYQFDLQSTKNNNKNFKFQLMIQKTNITNEYKMIIKKSDEYNINNIALQSWISKRLLSGEGDIIKDIEYSIIVCQDKRKTTRDSKYSYKELISTIKDFIKHKNIKCIICGNQDERNNRIDTSLDDEMNICLSTDCKKLLGYIYLGNGDKLIENYWKDKKTTIEFFVYLLTKTLLSNRIDTIYHPRPPFFKESNLTLSDVESVLSCKVTDIEVILNLYFKEDENGLIKGDYELYKTYPYLYMTIKYAVNILSKYYVITSSMKGNLPKNSVENVFEIQNEDDDAQVFNDDTNDYLFHGSNVENWISIMSNGLQTGTKENKLFLNGAAYGAGIYLSDSAQYSYGYMNRSVNSPIQHSHSEYLIMGVFQVAKPKVNYYKNTNIYVVSNGAEIKLRYLIVFSSKSTYNNQLMIELSNKFGKGEIKKEIKQRKETTEKVGSKRLMKEYGKLQKMSSLSGEDQTDIVNDMGVKFTCELADGASLDVWNIDFSIDNLPKEGVLYKQLLEKKIDNIKMEFRFSSQYPIEPPFCRVVYPRFKFMTMNITRGGSFCNTMLTKQGWSPILTVDKVLLQIMSLMLDDDGGLDPINWNQPYTMYEAQDAYKRMIRSHGW